jgi:pimeloyl-ACP methyl ester carboxylesterase
MSTETLNPDAERVLMLHSSMSSKSQWRPFTAALPAGFQALTLNLLGYGEHYDWKPRPDFSLKSEAEFVHTQVADRFGETAKMHVVGHSYGAAVAIQFAALYPDRVKSLVLYEPVCFGLADPNHDEMGIVRGVWLRVTRNIALKLHYEAARVFADYWGGKGSFLAMPQDARDRMAALVAKVPWDFRALFEADISSKTLGELDIPTLLMHGGKTHGVVKHIAARLQAAAPRVTHRHLPEADHLSPMRAPQLVIPTVMEYLAQSQVTA